MVHRFSASQVYVARALDRESRDQFSLTVTASDGTFTANTTVTIDVLDVNGQSEVGHNRNTDVARSLTLGMLWVKDIVLS